MINSINKFIIFIIVCYLCQVIMISQREQTSLEGQSEPICSLIKRDFPVPISGIILEMLKLPNDCHNPQAFDVVYQSNQKAILQEFEQILNHAVSGISANFLYIPKRDIVEIICRNLISGNSQGYLYANQIKKISQPFAFGSIQNDKFLRKIAQAILQKHSKIYNLSYIPETYNQIIYKMIRKITTQYPQGKQQIPNMICPNASQHFKEFEDYKSNSRKERQQRLKIINKDTSRLSFYEFNMMYHLTYILKPEHLEMIPKNPYINSALKYIDEAIRQTGLLQKQNNNFQSLCSKVEKQLYFVLGSHYKNNKGIEGFFYEIQSWMIIMIQIYKSVADNYDAYRRRILKNIFTAFANSDIVEPIETLRWLENHRKQIRHLTQVQSFEDVLSNASAITFEVHNNRHHFLGKHIVQYMPKLVLHHISSKKLPRRKTVNIWVSGFLSEDQSKEKQWKKLLKYMPDSQIYAVHWESDTTANLVKFFAKSCKDILTGSGLRAELNKKFKNNPFLPAFETAQISGRYLAEIIVRLFPHQFINIAGYSLGTELIKQFLERMIELNAQSKLSHLYLMGGVTDITELAEIINRSKYPLNLWNCYTKNDMVLAHLLSLCRPQSYPIGLFQVPCCKGHQINNLNVSSTITGHLAYMAEFDTMGRLLDMEKQ